MNVTIGHWLHDFHEEIIAASTFGLFLVTTALAVYTARLWSSTAKLVDDAKDTAEKELRAYVFIKSCSIVNIGVGQNPMSGLTIHNFGKTPARKMAVLCGMGFGESFGNLPRADADPKPMGTLAPGGQVIHNFSPHTMTADHIAALQAGTHSIFVYGEIRYVDFTGRKRFTKFRTMKNTTVGLDNPYLASCEEGNETDENQVAPIL